MADYDPPHSEFGNRDILKKILEKIGGERKEPEAAGRKVTCKMRCTVLSLGPIDTIEQKFWAKVYIAVQWRDNELKDKDVTLEDIDWNKYWDPQIHFVNVMEVDYEERWHTIIENDDGSTDVKLSIRMRATFKSRMGLKYFPFDCQNLTIQLMSDWAVEEGEGVEFRNDHRDKDGIRTDTFTDVQEWELLEHILAEPAEDNKKERKRIGFKNKYPHYHITMKVKRKYAHYIWNIALVMSLLLLLSLASFSIPSDDVVGRFSVTVALLLTAVAYKFLVNNKLPVIPYLTLLDKYVLSCITIHALIVIQNAPNLALSRIVSRTNTIDYIFLGILGCITLAAHVFFAVVGIRETKKATVRMNKLRALFRKVYHAQSADDTESYGAIDETLLVRD